MVILCTMNLTKVDVCKSNMVKFAHLYLSGVYGSKSIHKLIYFLFLKTYLIKIELHVQNMLTIASLKSRHIRGPIWPFNEHNNLHFDNQWDNHRSSENYEACWLWTCFEFANYFTLIACFISYEQWIHNISQLHTRIWWPWNPIRVIWYLLC